MAGLSACQLAQEGPTWDQRPPTSPTSTTSLALPRRPTSSGCVHSFLLLAATNAAPSLSAVPGRADPSQCKVETRVVSIANCAPPNNGNPSATISSRRASAGFGAARSISRIITFVVTRGPPSRQILAAALSTACPRLPKTPTLAHPAQQ